MVRDMFGRELNPGALILMRKYELNPYKIVSIDGPIVQRTPMGLVPMQKIILVSEMTVNVAGENGCQIEAMLVRDPETEEKAPEKKSNLLSL